MKSLKILFCIAAFSAVTLAQAATVRQDNGNEFKPSGKGWGEIDLEASGKASGQASAAAKVIIGPNGINYHGGPLILGSTNVYYIWYGNWGGNTATSILTDLATSVGASPYYNINTTYYNGSNVHVSNAVSYINAIYDNYSQGAALNDAQVQSVVANAISSGSLPTDANAVYFVLTSADVNETSGF